jgi:capsular exopolysaccharide synthesis family protein
MMKLKQNREFELIAHKNPKSAVAEAYRTLRTNLGFAELDQPCRSIMISSSEPMDGKSTIIANLAVVMAQAGKKTLLVDCDLRKPVQHRMFGVHNHKGITNCLLQHLDVEEAAHQGIVENLTLLTSGPIPPNPAEILSSERTRNLWPALLKKYEYVFIDAPPVLAVTDAAILSTQVDGVILVVSSANTRIDLARNAQEQFIKANARIIGVVLNKIKVEKHDYNYYYYSDNHAV